MIIFDLKLLLFLGLLVPAAIALLAIMLDRRRFRDPLWVRSGAEAPEIKQSLEAAPFGLMILDLQQSLCVYANAYARGLLGLTPAPGELPESAWRTELYSDLATVRQAGPPRTHYRVLNLPSEQALSWWICPFPNLSLVFLADLSRQHNLEQAAHLFLGSLSHELRTPLTAMLTHLEVLRTPEIPEAVRQNSLSLMHQETRRIAKLVEGLVDLNRLQITPEVSEQPLDLLLVAEEAIAEIILEAEARQIQVSLEAGAPLPRVRGDPDRLKQVFLNVLDNAVKYVTTQAPRTFAGRVSGV